MLYLSLSQVLLIHERVMQNSGGAAGVRDMGALESALAQPKMAFQSQELYPTLAEKAAAIGHSIIQNHPFIDGNKRTGHAAMEIMLVLNGFELSASVDEQEEMILNVASGKVVREDFGVWVAGNIVELN